MKLLPRVVARVCTTVLLTCYVTLGLTYVALLAFFAYRRDWATVVRCTFFLVACGVLAAWMGRIFWRAMRRPAPPAEEKVRAEEKAAASADR